MVVADVLMALGFVALVVLLIQLQAVRKRLLPLMKSMRLSVEQMKALNAHVEKVSDFGRHVSGFTAGMQRIGEAQVKAITELEISVTAFTRMSMGVETSGNGRVQDSFAVMADNHEIGRIAAEQGISREEAKEELRRNRAYDFGAA